MTIQAFEGRGFTTAASAQRMRGAGARRLTIGKGHIDNVMPEVWAYEVLGKN